ncbi:MAG: hypothetical protein L6V89_06790 [Oscillospiraceae bacterium]|nr:MAG: hypothetical protein L6V89_06790 [Oscillospiraceae bacterium]
MKKKEIIIIFLAIILLICINSLYFIVPVSYAGTSKKPHASVDEHKFILPTEIQASRVKKGMSWAEVIDTIGLPQKNYGSGICIYEFYLRDGHRLWIYTDGWIIWNTSDIVHSDYPYQTREDYRKRRREEKNDAFAVTPWNNMYGAAANSLPDAA